MQRLIDADAVISGVKNRCIGQNDVVKVEHSIISMLYMMPTINAVPQWIPCSERLPEEDCETGKGVQYSDYVLMSVEHKGDEETIVDYGHTVDGKWYSDYTDCFIPQEWKVIAWMPLPKPYEVEE